MDNNTDKKIYPNVFNDYKPIIDTYILTDNGESCFLRHNQHTIKIETDYYVILSAIQHAHNMDECTEILTQKYDELDKKQVENVCAIVVKRIFETLETEIKDYTHFNINLINVGRILPYLNKINGMFAPKVFFIWFSCLVVLGALAIIFPAKSLSEYRFDLQASPYYMLIFLCIGIVHELGHITSATRVSDSHPKVSFGFYMFMPVFFTDVSHMWVARRIDRIVTTMAGYAVQMICAVLFLYLGMYYDMLFNIGLMAFIGCFMGLLIPFGRSDGYWLLVDMTGINNLMQDFYKRLYCWNWTGINKVSLIFGVTNLCFMMLFFTYSIYHLSVYFKGISLNGVYTHFKNYQDWQFSFTYQDLLTIAMVLFLLRICFGVCKGLIKFIFTRDFYKGFI